MPAMGADPLNRQAEEDVLIWPPKHNQLEGWTSHGESQHLTRCQRTRQHVQELKPLLLSSYLPDKSSERARPPTGLQAHSQSSSREMWCRKMDPFQKSGSSQMRNYREDSLPWKQPCLLIPDVFIRELSTQAHQLVSTASKHCGAVERTMLNGWRPETGLLVPGSAAF